MALIADKAIIIIVQVLAGIHDPDTIYIHNGENKMKLKTTIAINGMAFRVYEDNGMAICHTSASVPQKIADKVRTLSGRYNSASEVTKSVINLIKEL